jgi:DNA-binding GntR family transcriptional regulator
MNEEIHNTSDHEIYDRVISAILDHRLQPGTKLSETKLAEAFGVSRTRIRPVLVRLANEQVVNLTHNKGATIVEPTEIEAREVFLLRRLIEPVLIELFIKQANDKDILSLKESLEEELNAISTADIRKSIRLSGDFHLLIAQGSKNSTMYRTLKELISRTSLILMAYSNPSDYMAVDSKTCTCSDHRSLLDAIKLKDIETAKSLMISHLIDLESSIQFNRQTEDKTDLELMFKNAA